MAKEQPIKNVDDFGPDKVLYIEIDDEVTSIVDRIKQTPAKKVALVIPKRALVLQSSVNFNILKKKTAELGKELLIITPDVQGLNNARTVGLPALQKLFTKIEKHTTDPKSATFSGDRPTRIMRSRVSISDVIHNEKPSKFSATLARVKDYIKKKKILKSAKETKLVLITPNKQALFTLVLVSVLLLLAVAYIALPGATIYLTPRSTILDPSFNVTFMDYDRNKAALEAKNSSNIQVASYVVNPPPITKKIIRTATGKNFQGENARGVIILSNFADAPWDLAARTRFQTDHGIVFRTPVAIRVPARRGTTAGTLEVSVVADEVDALGQIIGDRGNIPPVNFSLPGLKNEENRKKLTAKSIAPMTGGRTSVIKSISKEDVEAAREAAKREVLKGASEDLKNYLREQNIEKKRDLTILNDRNLIKTTEPIATVPDSLIGSPAEQFEVSVTYTVKGVAFDKQELISALKARVANRADPEKKISKIDEADVSYKFLDENVAAGTFRLTTTMRAVQVYELDPTKENGKRFIKKLTDHILGMRISEAEEYLQQQTDEISHVRITTWPIWAPTIPNIADNIKFVISDE